MTVTVTRSEHLRWCKARAIKYVDAGDLPQAFASMASDLGKHDETQGAAELCQTLGMPLLIGGHLGTPQKMREFIVGFN